MSVTRASNEGITPNKYCLENILGEGKYRLVFPVNDETCMKIVKPKKTKRIGPFSFQVNTALYLLVTNRVRNINQQEFKNYSAFISQISPEIKSSFGELIGLTQEGNLLAKIIRDWDGRISKSLTQYFGLKNPSFSNQLEKIEQEITSKAIPYFNNTPHNVLVQWVSPDEANPVFIDYKRFGYRSYSFQPALLLTSGVKRKISSEFERIKQYHQGRSNVFN